MKITSFFIDKGTPKTGLSPTIDIWTLDGTQVVTAQAMTEIAGGLYYYDFTTYDENEDYVIRADGTGTLSGSDRYVYGNNENAPNGKILKLLKNKWEIKGNQMIFYDDDDTTPIYTYNLQTKNGTGTEKDVYKRVPV